MKNYEKAAKLVIYLSIAGLASGCTTLVAYTPNVGEAPQALRYTQGVGTLSEKDDDHEIFIYPKFRTQPTTMPTFTIGYANGSAVPVNFTTNNVKAYFRGSPVPLYTYTERVAEIDAEKRGRQVALAIVGGLAAGAAAYGASHRETFLSANWPDWITACEAVAAAAGINLAKNQLAYRTATLKADGVVPEMLMQILAKAEGK